MKQRRACAVISATGCLAATGLLGPVGVARAASHATTGRCTPTITALPMPAHDTNGDILSVSGRVAVGFVADDAQHQSVTIWRKTGTSWSVQNLGDFGITEPFSGLSATGVNSRGEVAIGVNTNIMGGWLYAHGAVHRLRDFAGGTNAFARAINDHGEIVGEALDAAGNDFGAVWNHWSARPRKLRPTTGYDGSFAQGVNDRGDVVGGSFSNGPSPTLAVRWSPSGRPAVLHSPVFDGQGAGINAAGRVAGNGSTAAGDQRALVWNRSGHVRNLGVFSGSAFSRAIGVSARGDVVGFEGVNPPPPAIPVRHVLFWLGHGPARTLLPLSLDWHDGAYSHTMDNNGDVFGASSATHGSQPQPTEWTCARQQSFVPAAGAPAAPTVVSSVRIRATGS
jgi:uncharacterized membrane protein